MLTAAFVMPGDGAARHDLHGRYLGDRSTHQVAGWPRRRLLTAGSSFEVKAR